MPNPFNTAEGGTNGTTVTTGNSGGASGDAFDSVTAPPGDATLIFDNTHVAHGSLAYKFQIGATSTQLFLQWLASVSGTNVTNAKVWFNSYLTANPAASLYQLHVASAAAAQVCGIRINTSGQLIIVNQAGSTIGTMTSAIPLNAWFRVGVDIALDSTGTNVNVTCTRYDNIDSAQPSDSVAATGATAVPFSRIRFGWGGTATTNAGPWWMDDVQVALPVAIPSAQPGQTWLRRFKHRQQTIQPPPVVSAPPAATVVEFIRPAAQPTRAAPRGRFWGPVQGGQTNAPVASWLQGHGKVTPNKAGRFWIPRSQGQTNAPRASFLRQNRGQTPQARGRFWGPPRPVVAAPVTAVASWLRQRTGTVLRARGSYWAPHSQGQTNKPVASFMRGRARVVVNQAGKWWKPVPAPPATITRAVASFMRQRRGTVPQDRGRWWAPRSQGQTNAPVASFRTTRPRPTTNRAGKYWTAPPSAPIAAAQPPHGYLRQRTAPPAPVKRGKFWARVYPGATPAVSKPVASFMRGRGKVTPNKAGKYWTPVQSGFVDANGRVVVNQTVTSTVDAGGPTSFAGVTQTNVSSAIATPTASGGVRVDPTEDGRAGAG